MKHCGTNELDLWRVFLGRSENRESSLQALNESLLIGQKLRCSVICGSETCPKVVFPFVPIHESHLSVGRVLQRIFTGCLHL